MSEKSVHDYKLVLEGAGPKLKELILACAFRDKNISVWDLEELVKAAYPEKG